MTTRNLPQPDVTLFLDREGVIRRAALSTSLPGEGLDAWVGRPWSETVEPEGGESLRQLVEDAAISGVSAFRQVTQRFPSGRALPIEYTAVRLGGQAGLVAIGRSLQAVTELQSRLVEAQQTMERDYWKLREVETRYRLLFRSSTDAVLLLRASTLGIVEANPVAATALGLTPPVTAAGQEFLAALLPAERDALQAMLNRVAEQGQAPGILLQLGTPRVAWMVHASLLSSESGAVYLLQLSPAEAVAGVAEARAKLARTPPLEELLERLPDGFAITDRLGLIQRANQGCLDLLQMPTESSVIHETLGRWLGHPGADLAVLLANVQRLGAVRMFATVLHGELGTETDVEISAAGNREADPEFVVVLIRAVGRRLTPPRHADRLNDRLGALTGQIGKHSLRTLVEETVGVVERYYIEEALEATRGNRTATAELLGLSRQSLYVKLNRYGLDTESVRAAHGNVE
ncbi:transcriptional regulator PpsR [Thiocystis violascens]|uniref:Transcriptional regulator PpsR n=1 Tax=Thiocystis violascens (strain ATCC 17096 / DSM 198 / 6111) TaxID=765911 RepID=I3YBD8_THIV6|nr:transcriptional regulator PpsR [Thiocystis violascens]AFL74306.1 transcriptional regulator PpsR [Thiocystis violascens DSM 198]